jgi:hypothetical protein
MRCLCRRSGVARQLRRKVEIAAGTAKREAKKKRIAVTREIVRTWGAAVLRPYMFVAARTFLWCGTFFLAVRIFVTGWGVVI